MKNTIKKNYIFNVAYQIFALLVPLITTPYISRVLGVEGVGIYSYTYSILRYFWLASALGTSTYGTRNIGIYQDDRKKRSYYFWNIISLKVILSLFIGVIYLGYVILFSSNKLISILQGINLLAVMFDITWLFQGIEKFDKVAIKNFCIKIINVIFIFLLIKTEQDLPIYVFGLAFFLFIGNFSMWFNLSKYVDKVNLKELKPFKDFNTILQLFIPSVAAQIFSVFDKSMIGWFTSNSLENGYYEQSIKIIDMSLVIITTLGTVMIPKISREFKNGNSDEVKKYMTKSFKFTFALAIPMIFGVLAISEKFVPIFFGNDYSKSSILLNILCFLFLFMGINSVTGTQYLISTGQQSKHTMFLAIGGFVNISLNLILIPKFKSIGAAVASVIGEATIAFLEIGYLYITKQYNILKALKGVGKYLVSGILMFGFIFLTCKYIENLVGIFISIIIGGALYFISLLILREELIYNEFIKVKNKFLRSEK